MSKPILLAIGGAVAGVVVALAVFMVLFRSEPAPAEAAPPAEPTPVAVPGKLGPHLTLSDRVFNLLPGGSGQPVYLKLQTVIEFETTDKAWARVLNGCVDPKTAVLGRGDLVVSAAPGGRGEVRAPAAPGGGGDACQSEHDALLASFRAGIGTGLQLIEDAVTLIVTGHTAEELATLAGKEALKAEIQHAVDEIFHGHPKVSRVLFLNFITQ
jgi:flagellar basal body-associated protein FliL